MWIYNITFATGEAQSGRLLSWIKKSGLRLFLQSGEADSWKLLRVVPNPCETEEMLASVCLQLGFSSKEKFECWQEESFRRGIKEYTELFSPEPLFFATLLEELDLNHE